MSERCVGALVVVEKLVVGESLRDMLDGRGGSKKAILADLLARSTQPGCDDRRQACSIGRMAHELAAAIEVNGNHGQRLE